MRFIAAFLAFLFAFATPLAAQPAAPAEPPIVAEARAFMAAYAEALLAGDRAGISGRYDRGGTFFLGNGGKRFETHAQIIANYASQEWQAPHRFEWRDLSYEAIGADAVIVAGRFAWTAAAGMTPFIYSYTGLLRRQQGTLRIRLEDESTAPPRVAAPAGN